MAKSEGVCIVCGDKPTVKSHLYPRAIMLDMRADARTLLEASARREGYVERQNGIWDDRFLCKRHEDLAGGGDDYVIRLTRRLSVEATQHPMGVALQISNPNPQLLMRFAYGTVWRHLKAPVTGLSPSALGPYLLRFEAALFGNGPFDLPLLVSVNNLRGPDGEVVPLALSPHRVKFAGRHAWHFIVGNLEFTLKADQVPWPTEWSAMYGREDPLILFMADPMPIATVPMLRHLTDRIRRAPYRGKR